jgi:hypothetical protein
MMTLKLYKNSLDYNENKINTDETVALVSVAE